MHYYEKNNTNMMYIKGGSLMENEFLKLSVSEFAKLHGVNKRTLHYYDKVGLFAPKYKGSNHYRYYDYKQSIDFENIRMLRELNMSIDEIKQYLANPSIDSFIQIADNKMNELNKAAIEIENIKRTIEKKKQQLELCKTIHSGEIKIIERPEEYLFTTLFSSVQNGIREMMEHLKKVWDIEQCKTGCGSFISVEKIKDKKFDTYDGLYTPIQRKIADLNCTILPGGTFICAYYVGRWEELSGFYDKIINFADKNRVQLIGNAYEIGLNEFAIKNREDYITQILIQIKNMY